jgi:hypothetical protein
MRIAREAWTNVAFLLYIINLVWTSLLLLVSKTFQFEDISLLGAFILFLAIPMALSVCMGVMIGLMIQVDTQEPSEQTPLKQGYGSTTEEWPRASTA